MSTRLIEHDTSRLLVSGHASTPSRDRDPILSSTLVTCFTGLAGVLFDTTLNYTFSLVSWTALLFVHLFRFDKDPSKGFLVMGGRGVTYTGGHLMRDVLNERRVMM